MRFAISRFKILLVLFLCSSYSCQAKESVLDCMIIQKNKVCLMPSVDEYGESASYLKMNSTEYSKASYYDNAKLKKVSNDQFVISTNFSDRGNVDIFTIFSIKQGKPFIEKIHSVSRVNEAPDGGIEDCNVKINQYFVNDINYYIDTYIFDLPSVTKKKVCSVKKFTQ